MRKDYQSNLEAKKALKRYALTVLCSLPVLFLVGFFLLDKVSRGVRIMIFVLILLSTCLIEEYIYAKIQLKKKDKPEDIKNREDVFKK